MTAYKLFTDEFSAWYLEIIKPAYQAPIDRNTYEATLRFFETLMKILHPFMPFITEELYQHIAERTEGESIMTATLHLDPLTEQEKALISQYEEAKQIISGIRAVRNAKNIAQKEALKLEVVTSDPEGRNITHCPALGAVITKMANLDGISYVQQKGDSASSFLIGTTEYAVPLGNLIDTEAELQKMQAEVTRLEGFLNGIKKKLSNEKFVANAPAQVVELERKKQADAETKIAALKENIAALQH